MFLSQLQPIVGLASVSVQLPLRFIMRDGVGCSRLLLRDCVRGFGDFFLLKIYIFFSGADREWDRGLCVVFGILTASGCKPQSGGAECFGFIGLIIACFEGSNGKCPIIAKGGDTWDFCADVR